MAERLSSYQYSILKAMAPAGATGNGRPLKFDRAVEFNQIMFYSLIRRDLIHLDLTMEAFFLSDKGLTAYNGYTRGDLEELIVKNNPEPRQQRVSDKLHGVRKRPRKQTAKAKAEVPAVA